MVDKSFNYEKDYKNNKTKIPCRCKKHPDNLLFFSLIQIDGHIKCPLCKKESISFRKEKGYNIKEIKEIMGKDYILLDSFKDEDWVKRSHTILHFSCKKHGEFSIRINSIYRNSKCPLCGKENISKKQKIDFEEIKEVFEARGYILLSQQEDYKGIHSKLHYKCPHHPNKDLYITYDALK